jgi:hypothetical protein
MLHREATLQMNKCIGANCVMAFFTSGREKTVYGAAAVKASERLDPLSYPIGPIEYVEYAV